MNSHDPGHPPLTKSSAPASHPAALSTIATRPSLTANQALPRRSERVAAHTVTPSQAVARLMAAARTGRLASEAPVASTRTRISIHSHARLR